MQKRDITVAIPEYKTEFVEGKETTFYILKVKSGKKKWSLKRRYNEFATLKAELVKSLGNIPGMPGKTFFRLKSPDQINKRRIGLEEFVQKLTERFDVLGNDVFLEFLEVSVFLDC